MICVAAATKKNSKGTGLKEG